MTANQYTFISGFSSSLLQVHPYVPKTFPFIPRSVLLPLAVFHPYALLLVFPQARARTTSTVSVRTAVGILSRLPVTL
jgi:hypothetical protein